MLISVFEYGVLKVNHDYGEEEKKVCFKQHHFEALSKYLTQHKKCGFFSLYNKQVQFLNYVGVIKVGNLTIEVLPKIEKAHEDKNTWRDVLFRMLKISLKVQSKTSTSASIHINHNNVLEAYLDLFLSEVGFLLHKGLVKKYKKENGNKKALKGKLLFALHIKQNLAHAERFYVAYTDYNKDNPYNYILKAAVECISQIKPSLYLFNKAKSMEENLPECTSIAINEQLFSKLKFDRKTDHYKKAIELARIILLNYHPDVKSGSHDILAIMFDMNHLWENYVYFRLKKAGDKIGIKVEGQQKRLFWSNQHENWNLRLKPDLVLSNAEKTVIIDTKWKYDSQISIQDIRQVYAYGHYFSAKQGYLLYPDKLPSNETFKIESGIFYSIEVGNELDSRSCSLMYVDILKGNCLFTEIGEIILDECFR